MRKSEKPVGLALIGLLHTLQIISSCAFTEIVCSQRLWLVMRKSEKPVGLIDPFLSVPTHSPCMFTEALAGNAQE